MINIIKQNISQTISAFLENRNKYTVWITANVSDTVQEYESFIKHSDFSEFFTKAEFSSIVSAISETFGYVRIFYSESEFIKYVLENKNQIDTQHTIVYNFTRDGVCEGKKALIPAFCDLYGLNYIGSNPFVVSLLRNKFVFTKFLESMNIPVPITDIYSNKTFDVSKFSNVDNLIIKNINESASIGLDNENIIVNWKTKDVYAKLEELCKKMNSNRLLVQNYIDGIECEVFVVREKDNYLVFPPVALSINGSNILTSEISNLNDYRFYSLSDKIDKQICETIIGVTQKAANLLNIKNYARFDYRIETNGDFYLIDIAGSPYLTRHSSVAYMFMDILGMEYHEIFSLLAAIANKNQLHDVNCKSDNRSPREK